MQGIFCGYYDEEIEQDVPLQPSLNEAILFFRNFKWENEREESTMKILMFQAPGKGDASLHLSSLEKDKWCISARVFNRRKFLGAFFKRDAFNLFIDKNAIETEELIRLFYQKSLPELTALIEANED